MKSIIFVALTMISGFAGADSVTLVPGQFGSGQVFLNCQFDSLSRICQLDTGASSTFLQEDSETKSLSKIGNRTFKTAAGTDMTCDEIQPQSIQSASISLEKHVIARCPAPMKSTIGMDVIKDHKIVFDFRNGKIESFDQLPPSLPVQELKPLGNDLITVSASIGKKTIDSVWDTGAGLTSVSRDFVAANPKAFKLIQSLGTGGGDTSGHPIQMDLYRLSHIEIGDVIFENISVLVFDFSPIKQKMGLSVDVILGYNLVTTRTWSFDFPGQRFTVE